MNFSPRFLVVFGLGACLFLTLPAAAQDPSTSPSSPPKSSTNPNPQSRITVEVKGGDKDVPVENASVYFTYMEEHKIKKNKTLEINVKTNQEGVAHIPDAPMGRVRIQVIAEGWKTYGRWLDLDDPKQVLKIHLERPVKWY